MELSNFKNTSYYVVKQFIQNETKSCIACNGYYGKNYNQPFCRTCHLFLFPPFSSLFPNDVLEKCDSCDSGNEESNDYDQFLTPQSPFICRDIIPTNNRLEKRLLELSSPRDHSSREIPSGLVDSLPTEVLLNLFNFLDDLSLYNVRRVCRRWSQILDRNFSEEEWNQFVKRRWPLFSPPPEIPSWRDLYCKLYQSSNCLYCLDDLLSHHETCLHFSKECPWRYSRLHSERKNLQVDHPDGVEAVPLDSQYFNWQASISGPSGSPYEGGIFFLHLQIPPDYPIKPPFVHFTTKIFHPNISCHGDIGLDSINDNWSISLTIAKVLISIQSLLTDPYAFVCMEPSIGRLYTSNRNLFEHIARLWTRRYASHHSNL